jgi:hypothetical protein
MSKRKGEIQMKIVDFLTAITSRLTQWVVHPIAPPFVGHVEDVICFIVIDRTCGRVWELPSDIAIGSLRKFWEFDVDVDAEAELTRIRRQSAAYGMSAMMRGFTTMVWGEVHYHFADELRFDDEQGTALSRLRCSARRRLTTIRGIRSSSKCSSASVKKIYKGVFIRIDSPSKIKNSRKLPTPTRSRAIIYSRMVISC